jgi:hypothetical protein
MTMTSHYVTVLECELHYVEWGAGNGENVVMWHAPALNVPGQIGLVEEFLAA